MSGTVTNQLTEYFSPTKILFGLNAAASIGNEIKALGGKKALITTDKVLSELNVIRPVLDALDAAGIPYVLFDEVLPNAPVRLILKGLDILRSENCDILIGIGGGSPLDTAKGIALMATNGTDIRPMLGWNNVKKRGLPKISVPTTTVGGADVGFALVTTIDEETGEHGIIRDRFAIADVVIADPLLTVSMPQTVTADTGLDVLTNGIECITSSRANPFSDLFAEKVIELCTKYLPVAYEDGSNLEARYNMALSASMSGLAYMSSRLGAAHGLGYTIAEAANLTHGRSLAAILPAVMEANLSGCPGKFRRIADLMGKDTTGMSDIEGGKVAITAVEDLLDTIHLPRHLRDYGFQEKDIPGLAKPAWEHLQISFLETNARPFTEQDVLEVFRSAL
jgi:alcohol dehydrogenase